jgi:CubicO group peptidase (beta-lactamase class C family)
MPTGGGYLILELLVEEVSGQPFDAFMRDAVLQPLGMSRSTYEYLGDIESSANRTIGLASRHERLRSAIHQSIVAIAPA